MRKRQVIYGQYAVTCMVDAYTGKQTYWLTKRGCRLSMAIYTVTESTTNRELEKVLSEENVYQCAGILEDHLMRYALPENSCNDAFRWWEVNRTDEKNVVTKRMPYRVIRKIV